MWNPSSASSRNASGAVKAAALALTAWIAAGSLAVCADPDQVVSVKAQLDRASVTIGDPITYEVIVKRRKDIQLLTPVGSGQLKDFEIKGIRDIAPVEEKGMIRDGRSFSITTYEVGEYVIEGVPLTFRLPEGKTQILTSERLYVSVKSVIRSGEREPEDIRGAKGVVPYAPGRRIGLLALALLTGAAVAGALYAAKRRRVREKAQSSEPALSSHDEAFRALSELYDSDLLRRGEPKAFAVRLSEIARRYLERRFLVPALESTTFEIRRSLRDKAVSDSLETELFEILSALDLVKFAKDRPAPTALLDSHKKVKSFVTETQERPAVEPAATAQ